MGGRTGNTIACVAAVAFALAGAGAAGSATVAAFRGTVTFRPVDVAKTCTFSGTATKNRLTVECHQRGAFAGTPGKARASYEWTWNLAVDENKTTTGHGTERGTLALDFGRRGLVHLALTGTQAPVGAITPTLAKERTTGTWTVVKGAGGYAGKRGRGTYTFSATRTGSQTTFQIAKLSLRGSVA